MITLPFVDIKGGSWLFILNFISLKNNVQYSIDGGWGRQMKAVQICKQYLTTGHIWLDGKVEILHVPVKQNISRFS